MEVGYGAVETKGERRGKLLLSFLPVSPQVRERLASKPDNFNSPDYTARILTIDFFVRHRIPRGQFPKQLAHWGGSKFIPQSGIGRRPFAQSFKQSLKVKTS